MVTFAKGFTRCELLKGPKQRNSFYGVTVIALVSQILVMTFGASCSPSLANYIKNRNADRFKERFPSAVAAIVQNTFVDDWLQSVETEDEMIRLATEVRHIHSEGGFEMRHWLSNSERVLRVMAGQSELVDVP